MPVVEAAEGASRVSVLAVGTRARSTTDPGEMFSGERGDGLSYAMVNVSIPPDPVRTFGEVQWPASVPGDPHRDFVTVAADYLDKPSFVAEIRKLAKQTGYREVLLFVHGYNNRFDDAVYRFAQIVHDTKAPVIPVLFTWPSRGEVLAYTYDRESANYSRDALEEVIDALAVNPNVREISVLAHSMGNWVTLEALRQKSIRTGKIADKVRNVMLAAPDVDVDVFRTQIQRMGTARPQFTLFVSQDDRALRLSEHIWGDVPRLGQIDPRQEPYRSELEKQRISVIDMTRLKAPTAIGMTNLPSCHRQSG